MVLVTGFWWSIKIFFILFLACLFIQHQPVTLKQADLKTLAECYCCPSHWHALSPPPSISSPGVGARWTLLDPQLYHLYAPPPKPAAVEGTSPSAPPPLLWVFRWYLALVMWRAHVPDLKLICQDKDLSLITEETFMELLIIQKAAGMFCSPATNPCKVSTWLSLVLRSRVEKWSLISSVQPPNEVNSLSPDAFLRNSLLQPDVCFQKIFKKLCRPLVMLMLRVVIGPQDLGSGSGVFPVKSGEEVCQMPKSFSSSTLHSWLITVGEPTGHQRPHLWSKFVVQYWWAPSSKTAASLGGPGPPLKHYWDAAVTLCWPDSG